MTENMRRHLGETVTIRWGTSRGQDSYGYTTCSLRNHRGERVAACNGGGYDMRGTVLGNWLAATFAKELCALKPADMPAQSHWEPERARVCAGKCCKEHQDRALARLVESGENCKGADWELPKLGEDCFECPTCAGATRQSRNGKTIDDGRYFYGLTFHDPNYDPGQAIVGRDCADRTLGEGGAGATVAEAEKAGKSFGLERLQAAYKASSKHATKRHTVPSIDGACGVSSVMQIAQALGLSLRQVVDTAKLDVYLIEAHKA